MGKCIQQSLCELFRKIHPVFHHGVCHGSTGPGNPVDPADPEEPIDPINPLAPQAGEPLSLYVTQDAASLTAAQDIADCNELLFSWYSPDIYANSQLYAPQRATGVPTSARYWGTNSSSSGIVEYYFNRSQYITGYEMGAAATKTHSPKIWNLYLSGDGGETWRLADSQNFDLSTITTKAWTVEPGFYDACKLEVLGTCNNSRIALFSMRMQGLPTEVIPVNMEQVSRYGVSISSSGVTTPLYATWVTQNNHHAQFSATGYIDYAFDAVRQVRLVSSHNITALPTGKFWAVGMGNSGKACFQ